MESNQLDKLKNTLIEANRILNKTEKADNYNFGALKYFITDDIIELINKSDYNESVFIDSLFSIDRPKTVLNFLIKDCNEALVYNNNNRSLIVLSKILKELKDNNKIGIIELIEQH